LSVPPPPGKRFLDQGDQRHAAALAMVVGAKDDGDVLDAQHHDHGPDNERKNAQNVGFGDGQSASAEKPMSPNTTPKAPNIRSNLPFGCCSASPEFMVLKMSAFPL